MNIYVDELVSDNAVSSPVRRRLLDTFNRDERRPSFIEPYQPSSDIFPLPRVAPESIESAVLDPRGDENQHTNYVIPIKHFPKRAGSWPVDHKLTWRETEDFVRQMFPNLEPTSNAKNRNIDFQRVVIYPGWSQSIEVKLTSGHYHSAPGMIRSSTEQLNAMLNYKNSKYIKQMVPSLYCVCSIDFLKMELETKTVRKKRGDSYVIMNQPVHSRAQWYITIWWVPVYDLTHFAIINTQRQGAFSGRQIDVRERVKEYLAYLRSDEYHIDPDSAWIDRDFRS